MAFEDVLPEEPETDPKPSPEPEPIQVLITAREALDHVLSLRVMAYDQSLLLRRLLTLENMILTEIHFKEPIKEIAPETVLCAASPYSELYEQYLLAQIDLMDMELEQYNMDMQVFTNTYSEYAARYRRDNLPMSGKQVSGYD